MITGDETNTKPKNKDDKTAVYHNSIVLSTSLGTIGMSGVSQSNSLLCAICQGPEAFLMCQNCNKTFHHICANYYNPNMPFTMIYCSYCLPYLQSQCIQQVQNEIEYKKISAKSYRPKNLHKPIETLPESISKPLPKPNMLKFNSEYSEDLLYICDTLFTFSKIFKISPFSIDQLYENLTQKSALIKELHISVIKLLITHVLSKENSYEALSTDSKFLYSAAKLSGYFDINTYLPYA